MHNVHFTVHCH